MIPHPSPAHSIGHERIDSFSHNTHSKSCTQAHGSFSPAALHTLRGAHPRLILNWFVRYVRIDAASPIGGGRTSSPLTEVR